MLAIKAVTIEEIYQEILDGKRKRFPPNTWKEDLDNKLARRVITYLLHSILKWDKEDIRKKWNTQLLVKYKLRGLLKHRYENSPFKAINDLYPSEFKEWEFGMTPLNFWTKEKALTILRWMIEEKKVYRTKSSYAYTAKNGWRKTNLVPLWLCTGIVVRLQ